MRTTVWQYVIRLAACGIIVSLVATLALAYFRSTQRAPPLPVAIDAPLQDEQIQQIRIAGCIVVAPTPRREPWSYRIALTSSAGFGWRLTRVYELAIPTRPLEISEPAAMPPSRMRAAAVEVGWPFLAVGGGWRETQFSGNASRFETHGLVASRGTVAGNEYVIGVPYRPLWQGLLLNSAVYSVFIGAVDLARIRIRSHWRQAHGRCRCCGYLRTGLKANNCPECGSEL